MAEVIVWRYFIESDDPDAVENGLGGLLRLEVGDPWMMAEYLRHGGSWMPTDILARYHLHGSQDTEISETTPGRARRIVDAWHAGGRLTALPAVPPGGPDPLRSPEVERERAQDRERHMLLQARLERAWADSPVPPGATDVRGP